MRLVCYDWYVTVVEALPLLLPPRLTPESVHRLATFMPGFPGLRMLRINCTAVPHMAAELAGRPR